MGLIIAKCTDGLCHAFRDDEHAPACETDTLRADDPNCNPDDDVCEECDAALTALIGSVNVGPS